MTVTGIEAATKTKYRVFIDGQFAFVLYKGELSRFHLTEGADISEDLYEEIRKDVVLKRAKSRSLHLLTDMGRTEVELRKKLTKDEYPADIVEAAIDYVKSYGYIDDPAYARDYIDSRKGKKSRKELYYQLLEKGLDRDLVNEAMEKCYEKEDAGEAIRTLMRRREYDPETADETQKQRFMAYLMRKGFAYEDVRKVL